MSDFEYCVDQCNQAAKEGREIDDDTARIIGGMYAADAIGYSFATTGTTDPALWRSLFPNYWELNPDERLLADFLGTYLLNRDRDN